MRNDAICPPARGWAEVLWDAVATVAAVPIGALFLLSPRGRQTLVERFGGWRLPQGSYLWFHGASAGEIKGLQPVIDAVRSAGWCSECKILVTATTTTGVSLAQSFADEARLLPFDGSPWISRALGNATIKGFVGTETEVWPTLLWALHKRQIQPILLNARISDRSFPRYQWVRWLLAPALRRFTMVLCGDKVSVNRFVTLGASAGTTRFVGNSKYDSSLTSFSTEQLEAFRQEFWQKRYPTIVLGSVRPGEEEGWLRAIQRRLVEGVSIQLAVVPRHKEKIPYFEEKLASYGLPWRRRSAEGGDRTEPVVLVDTFGELERIYAIADLAFIGATLVPIGGHNPLEASARGVAVAVGPHHQNYRDVVGELRDGGALIEVSTEADIDRLVERVIVSLDAVRESGKAGKTIWMNHQGATHRILQEISGVVKG